MAAPLPCAGIHGELGVKAILESLLAREGKDALLLAK